MEVGAEDPEGAAPSMDEASERAMGPVSLMDLPGPAPLGRGGKRRTKQQI